ncbi:glycerol-3-phosphate phosphatase-like [Anneissia japonica]|uniref:glycerol-3-phosphate phosphatase-like n=1 Tax=Anneissia japonica TaxID=1529436 RepID=UPI0014256AB4|nr:glycerol-3-phosphate phosphatase-like [Anneissia japonica]
MAANGAAKCKQLTSANIEQFLDSIDSVLIDCDGVLWNANNPIEGAIETIQTLRERGKQPIFVTNNSTKSRRQYVEKFQRLGFSVSEEEIFGTAYVAALYFKHKLKFEGKVYLIGGSGLAEEFALQEIPFIGPGCDHVVEGEDVHDWSNIELDSEVRGVLVGFDPLITFRKVCRAASYLSNPSFPYIATNLDGRLPMPNKGRVIPGTGCLVEAVTKAAARQPTVVGKPNKLMFECVKEKFPTVDPERTVMVGDRLDTDILLGKNCNLKTLMVLTGISSLEDVERNQQSSSESMQTLVPDFYIPSFGQLHKLINKQ